MKEEWRSAMTTSGGQSVVVPGLSVMLGLSAGNSSIHRLVSKDLCYDTVIVAYLHVLC